MARIWMVLLVTAALGCTWVKLSEEGQGVHVGTPAEVVGCDKIGVANAKTRDHFVFQRSTKKVDEELEFLARNEAATLGGDTIVPAGPTTADGRRSFTVHRCH